METRPTGDTRHLAPLRSELRAAANMLAPELCLICSCLVCKIFDDPKNFKVNLRDISSNHLILKTFSANLSGSEAAAAARQNSCTVHTGSLTPCAAYRYRVQMRGDTRWQHCADNTIVPGDTTQSGTRDAGKKRHVNTRCDCQYKLSAAP